MSTHTQRMPEAWPSLLEASAQLGDNATKKSLVEMHYDLHALQPQELENNRYFAFGEIACALDSQLDLSEVRKETVDGAANEIVKYHSEYCEGFRDINQWHQNRNDGLFVGEIDNAKLAEGIVGVIERASSTLPNAIIRLADLLESHELLRTSPVGFSSYNSLGRTTLLNRGVATRNVRLNTFSVVAGLFETYLRSKIPPEEARYSDPLIHDLVNLPDLHEVDFSVVAITAAAKMHADQMRAHGLAPIAVSPSGVMTFDRKRFSMLPQRIAADTIELKRALHDETIGCPAVYVRGLIPRVLNLMPDIVDIAEAKIQQTDLV